MAQKDKNSEDQANKKDTKDHYSTMHSGEQRNPVVQKMKSDEQRAKAEKIPERVSPVSDPGTQNPGEGKDVDKGAMTRGMVGVENHEYKGKVFDPSLAEKEQNAQEGEEPEKPPEAELDEEALKQKIPVDQYGNYDPDKAAPGEDAPAPASFGPGASAGVAKHGKQPG